MKKAPAAPPKIPSRANSSPLRSAPLRIELDDLQRQLARNDITGVRLLRDGAKMIATGNIDHIKQRDSVHRIVEALLPGMKLIDRTSIAQAAEVIMREARNQR